MSPFTPPYESLSLAFDLTFDDLYNRQGLLKVERAFLDFLQDCNPEVSARYHHRRFHPHEIPLTSQADSDLIVELAPYVEDFLGELFNIKTEIAELQQKHHVLAPLFYVKRQFVQRLALRTYKLKDVQDIDGNSLRQSLHDIIGEFFTPLSLARHIQSWMEQAENHKDHLDLAARYAAWGVLTPEGQNLHKHDTLFHAPHKLNFQNLVEVQRDDQRIQGLQRNQRHRDGFALTDLGFTQEKALDQANYCIWCHHQDKDSCSKGLKPAAKPSTTDTQPDRFQKNTFGLPLTGCPLDEKISEMNEVKSQGYALGALAIVTIDNPMAAATGHRICNDCMKACIFQKQDPVDIPGVESRTLLDVLNLPWGFEIYSLLTRWNPLNFQRPLPMPDSGYKVLVVGMGPAGFTLAHHLMNDGHTVVGIDGLKIEPLPESVSGVDSRGNRHTFAPIKDVETLREPLNQRINGGFGGVAEYGITVRWDKNFLKMIRLLLERRNQFTLLGGIRFGGTLTIEQAFDRGFDHIALCMGAGSPTLIPLKNGLARGVRQASDFLMALQLTGAAKVDSLANLQVHLPALVIGGGLTAIDTATEVMAYYPVQVEKFHRRYEKLKDEFGELNLPKKWTALELIDLDEFLEHGQAIVQEREQALRENRTPNFQRLVQSWGGVKIVYRRDLTQAPSYTLNHEEVAKALEEGISIIDHMIPLGVEVDDSGQAKGLEVRINSTDGVESSHTLPARTILIAAGTKPNTNLTYDEPTLTISGRTFQAIDEEGRMVTPERLPKPIKPEVLMSLNENGKALSFFGDMHPSFAGNVVKAMGSAKQGYPVISRILEKSQPSGGDASLFQQELNHDLRATVIQVNRLTPTILEIVVKSPLAAKNFQPGQFYRLQNFETLAPVLRGTRMAMEGIALTGASVDLEAGTLSTIVLEMGGSSNLCHMLKPGEPVVLMGPTGTATEIPKNKTVLLVGGGLGNAVLFSIGQAMRQSGCTVIYFAGYKNLEDRYKISDIEAAADQVIWCCDEAPGFEATRPQDLSFVGNIVKAMVAYGKGELTPLTETGNLAIIDHLIAIGSDRMMAAVAAARHGVLAPYLNKNHTALGSINSPMQCMMKEICAQCLQRHVDPITGEERIVYSCANQDQPLDQVDFNNLNQRIQQNSMQEKLTTMWVDYCLAEAQ